MCEVQHISLSSQDQADQEDNLAFESHDGEAVAMIEEPSSGKHHCNFILI